VRRPALASRASSWWPCSGNLEYNQRFRTLHEHQPTHQAGSLPMGVQPSTNRLCSGLQGSARLARSRSRPMRRIDGHFVAEPLARIRPSLNNRMRAQRWASRNHGAQNYGGSLGGQRDEPTPDRLPGRRIEAGGSSSKSSTRGDESKLPPTPPVCTTLLITVRTETR